MRNPHAPRMQDPIWPAILLFVDGVGLALLLAYLVLLAMVA